jgi:hypothetical protein
MCLLLLSGCGVDNPYKAFDPQGVIAKEYIGMTEDGLLKTDRSLKTSAKPDDLIKTYSNQVIWSDKTVNFTCSLKSDKVQSAEYTYSGFYNSNFKSDSISFVLKAHDEMTKALGAYENANIEVISGNVNDLFENGTLPPINESVLNQIFNYSTAHPSSSILLRITWKPLNGVIPSLIFSLDLQSIDKTECMILFKN